MPDRDYDASAQSHHLERALDRRHDTVGGIIFAGEVHELRADLTSFCRSAWLPVVFAGLEPFEEAGYPVGSAFVGYDTGQLGKLAGRWLARHLRGIRHPRVLVIASREHSERRQECIRVLEEELPDVKIDIDQECALARSRAYNSTLHCVRTLNSRQSLHAISCTDDEMGSG